MGGWVIWRGCVNKKVFEMSGSVLRIEVDLLGLLRLYRQFTTYKGDLNAIQCSRLGMNLNLQFIDADTAA